MRYIFCMSIASYWSENELEVLRSSYGKVSYLRFQYLLPGRTTPAIHAMARALGLKANLSLSASIRRSGFRAYSLNYEYFAKLTVENCYWGGFIAADGCIARKPTPRISIGLSKKDREHLVRFAKCIEFSGPISDRQAKLLGKIFPYSQICISVQQSTLDDLYNWFNVIERKSLVLQPPNLKLIEHVASFIVGYVDGNGSIGYSKHDRSFRLGIRGSFALLTWIKCCFDEWCPSKKMVGIGTSDGYPKYQLSGHRLMRIAAILTTHSPIMLSRKWSAIVQALR